MSDDKVLCACGCGTEVKPSKRRDRPTRFILGHQNQVRRNSPETTAKMSASHLGKPAYNWKGGRCVKDGYVLIWAPEHPRQQKGYVREHVLVYEAAHGPVPKGSVVHHKNGDRQDNRDENLEAMTIGEHSKLHLLGSKKKPLTPGQRGGNFHAEVKEVHSG